MQPIPVVKHTVLPASPRAARSHDASGFSELLSQHLTNTTSTGSNSASMGSTSSEQQTGGKADTLRTNTAPHRGTQVPEPAGRGTASTEEKLTSAAVQPPVHQGGTGGVGVSITTGQSGSTTVGTGRGVSTTVVSPSSGEESPGTGWPVSSAWMTVADSGATRVTGSSQAATGPSEGSSTGADKKGSPSAAAGMASASLVGLPAGWGAANNPIPVAANENRANTIPSSTLSSNPAMSLTDVGTQSGTTPTAAPLTGMSVPVPETTTGSLSGINGALQLDTAVNAVTTKPAHVALSDTVNPLLSAAFPLSSTSSSLPSLVVSTPVGANQAWGNDVAQQITWMVGQQQSTAELQLNPPNLGPLTVVVQMAGNQANAFFSSPHAAVRDALQHALPHLSDRLAGSGLSLGQATVSDQRSGSGYSRGGSPSRSWDNLSSRNAVTEVSSGMSTTRSVSMTTRVGLIDTFA